MAKLNLRVWVYQDLNCQLNKFGIHICNMCKYDLYYNNMHYQGNRTNGGNKGFTFFQLHFFNVF